MATVISLINLKGGTGKTLMTMMLGEFMAESSDKRCLLIIVPSTTLFSELDKQLFKDKVFGNFSRYRPFYNWIADIAPFFYLGTFEPWIEVI